MTERPLVLAIVGGFSSGKSALLNAILRERVAPMGVTPVTAVPHKFGWASAPIATFVYNDATREVRALADLATLTGDAAEAARVREVRIGLPIAVLRDVEIWDTPGFGSNSLAHELAARKALADGDLVLWVTPIDQALSRTEGEKLQQLRANHTPVVLVVNKADLAEDAAERDEAVAAIAADAGDLVRFVAWASAKEALAAGEDAVGRARSGLAQLETRLADLLLECRARARERQAVQAGFAASPLKANEVRCPGCGAVASSDDNYCVCGRSLADQHRACPSCSADNVTTRPRCRTCNLEFTEWERGAAYAARAEEEVREGLMVDALASLQMAVDAVPACVTWRERLDGIAKGRERALELVKAGRRQPDAGKAIQEWARALDTLSSLGVAEAAARTLVGRSGLEWGRRNPDAEQAVLALEWWAYNGVSDSTLLATRLAERAGIRERIWWAELEKTAQATQRQLESEATAHDAALRAEGEAELTAAREDLVAIRSVFRTECSGVEDPLDAYDVTSLATVEDYRRVRASLVSALVVECIRKSRLYESSGEHQKALDSIQLAASYVVVGSDEEVACQTRRSEVQRSLTHFDLRWELMLVLVILTPIGFCGLLFLALYGFLVLNM